MPETVWVPVCVRGGKLRIEDRAYWDDAMKHLPDCEGVLKFTRSRPSKSLKQLGFLFGCCLPLMSDYTGHSVEYLLHYFEGAFSTVREEHVNVRTGEVEFLERVKGVSEMNTKEATDFIDKIRLAASELGVIVPDPDRNWRARRVAA